MLDKQAPWNRIPVEVLIIFYQHFNQNPKKEMKHCITLLVNIGSLVQWQMAAVGFSVLIQ